MWQMLRKHKLKTLGITIMVLAAAALLAKIFFFSTRENTITVTVQKGPLVKSLLLPGEIKAEENTYINAPHLYELVLTYLAPDGSFVKKGQVVATFDTKTLDTQRNKIELSVRKAQINVDNRQVALTQEMAQLQQQYMQAEIALSKARLQNTKTRSQSKMQMEINELDIQRLELELSNIKEKMDNRRKSLRNELEIARLELQNAQKEQALFEGKAKNYTLTAPCDGLYIVPTVWISGQQRKPQAGDTVWRGSAIGMIPDMAKLNSVALAYEVELNAITPGQEVTVFIDSLPGKTFDGTVGAVSNVPRSRGSENTAKQFEITITMDAQTEDMKPEMTTTNRVIIDHVKDALYVPIEALKEKNGRFVVQLKTALGVKETPVTTGLQNDTHVQITSGLSSGDEVVLY